MNKKQEILKWLKKIGRLPTGRIGALSNCDYHKTLKLLEELEKEGKVIKEKETRAIYWRGNGKNNR